MKFSRFLTFKFFLSIFVKKCHKFQNESEYFEINIMDRKYCVHFKFFTIVKFIISFIESSFTSVHNINYYLLQSI